MRRHLPGARPSAPNGAYGGRGSPPRPRGRHRTRNLRLGSRAGIPRLPPGIGQLLTRAPLSITELSRVTGIGRNAIYGEIRRGCLAARKAPGGAWGWEQVWSIEWDEAARWKAVYMADESRLKGRREGNHAAHKGAAIGTEKAKQ